MKTILSIVALTIVALNIITFIVSSTSYAVTFTVTNLNDSGLGSLRQAIEDANTNANGPGVVDEIVFDAALTGAIPTDAIVDNTFTGEMLITDDVTVTGPGAGVITIDAQMVDRIFNIDDSDVGNDIVVSISGLTFINGMATDGGAILNIEELSIDSCVFDSNTAIDFGGAILNAGLIGEITNSTFSGNNAVFNGGAISNNAGTIDEITNSTFSENSVDISGGAIDNVGTIDEITNSTFGGNSAGFGGAIRNGSAIDKITNSTFGGNTADEGGAIYNLVQIGEITNSTFSGNNADEGGAIYNAFVDLVPVTTIITKIANSTFSGNTAGASGGAIRNEDEIGEITNSTFSGNSAGIGGGAIQNNGPIDKITNSTFSENSTFFEGGAIRNSDTIMKITNSTFSGNTVVVEGGAIWNNGPIKEITNSTFSGNNAGVSGGAIWNDDLINISFTTIANNEAGIGGGIIEVGSATTNIRNSIVAHNTATTSGPNCDSLMLSGGALINNYSNDTSCGFDFDNANIILGPLADNGGPTETIALLGGDPLDGASPVCDPLNSEGMASGAPLPNDQRYFPRPFGPLCDSGAFENGPSASVKIKKVTDPPGGEEFDFITTGFEDLDGCGLQGVGGALVMNHGDRQSCAVPFGDYSVTEDIPEGQVLNIFCTDIPPGSVIDNDTGELSFSIINSQFNVNCLFINVTAQTLLNAMEEPPGVNCAFGGVKVETGLDTNLNGVLDPDEVLSTFYVCNGEPGATGPTGPQGPPGEEGFDSLIEITEEPPGVNCEFGGLKIETGLDLNRDGVLDPGEVMETAFVCNGADGEKGVNGSDCSLAGASTINGPSALTELLGYLLIPAVLVARRRFRRK